ncbi:YwbE family protein [Paenibacillus xylaniclasticus]|uniref:YwbE family protein n=1 Tax=Paenibacillus xylaniclasticus TaxID=588083 RepID=UPI000FD6E702|nr:MULTISPECIES: YwbE family protein [Paenibacillus]
MAGNGKRRSDVKPGLTVDIILKQDQRTGKTTRGIVKDLLTNSPEHPHGIKVRLTDGQVGRVSRIIEANGDDDSPERS